VERVIRRWRIEGAAAGRRRRARPGCAGCPRGDGRQAPVDWGDAGIGAGGVLIAILLATAGTFAVTRHRRGARAPMATTVWPARNPDTETEPSPRPSNHAPPTWWRRMLAVLADSTRDWRRRASCNDHAITSVATFSASALISDSGAVATSAPRRRPGHRRLPLTSRQASPAGPVPRRTRPNMRTFQLLIVTEIRRSPTIEPLTW
jgi:hypothetical protein